MQQEYQFSTRKSIVLTGIILLILFVLFEIVSYGVLVATGRGESIPPFHPLFRSRSDFTDNSARLFDPLYIYRLAPNQPYNPNININAQGIIDNGHPVDLLNKPEGTFRIIVFGGSTVAGTGASSNAGTITAFLERKLRAQGRKVEVINAGADGYFTLQELTYFAADMVHHQPDMVIFYDGVNDFTNPTMAGGYIDDYRRQFHKGGFQEYGVYLVRKFKSSGNPMPAMLNALRDNFYSAHLVIGSVRKLFNWRADFIPENVRHNDLIKRVDADAAAQMYLTNVPTMIGAVRQHGIKVMHLLQPTLLDKPTRTGEVENRFFTGDSPEDGMAAQFWNISRKQFAEWGRKMNSAEICVADLSGVFRNTKEEVFSGGVHLLDRGNDIVTDAMTPRVLDLMDGKRCHP